MLVSCLRNKITISDGGSTGKGVGLTDPLRSRRKNFQASSAPAPDDGADHSRKKLPIEFEDEPPMDTNERE